MDEKDQRAWTVTERLRDFIRFNSPRVSVKLLLEVESSIYRDTIYTRTRVRADGGGGRVSIFVRTRPLGPTRPRFIAVL